MSEIKSFKYDLVIVGGGPAGMACAVSAYEAGLRSILIIERDVALGGILRQCIHNGFGLHTFGEELTGPEYAYRYERKVKEYGIEYMLNTMVTAVGADKTVTARNEELGIFRIEAKAVALAMGCRERPLGALGICGRRPSGIFTAGTAQKYVNMMGYLPGREVVILGSGDIGLIMARRMTLEGATVKGVFELMPYSSGLARNIEQCLNDFGIPLKTSHTVVEVHGEDRLTGVTVAEVDENRVPIDSTRELIPCDTLLLSCGLIPENELTLGAGLTLDRRTGGALVDMNRQTEIEGIFSLGNVLHVHDLVDYVSEEAAVAGAAAARYIMGRAEQSVAFDVTASGGVRYTVPQRITELCDITLYFRVGAVYENKTLTVRFGDKLIYSRKCARLLPAEMQTVRLTRDKLAALGTTSGEIKVGLE
ncbi:MAG: FAD-dependent oxidoreductase [Clostridia bacterium]|nr:FAD-dependent oxidoreductase [Clostridia bacterium]